MRSKHFQRRTGSGYEAGPPWYFSGRAFYQLHLVKVDVAKRFIPSDLRIVQAFGYTLGGVYLAQYDNSPADVFDELVVIAGTVWNPPTSCAWAARVFVNSKVACEHGKMEVGLPSRIAEFSKGVKYEPRHAGWRWSHLSHNQSGKKDFNVKRSTIDISEVHDHLEKPLCQMVLPLNYGSMKMNWHGPAISLSLPSFSGRTEQQPHLLKYSCKLNCSVKPSKAANIITHQTETESGESLSNNVQAVLASKPILALCFYKMEMYVDAPKMVDAS